MERSLRFVTHVEKRKNSVCGMNMWCHVFFKLYICLHLPHILLKGPPKKLLTSVIRKSRVKFTNDFLSFYRFSVLQQVHFLSIVNRD